VPARVSRACKLHETFRRGCRHSSRAKTKFSDCSREPEPDQDGRGESLVPCQRADVCENSDSMIRPSADALFLLFPSSDRRASLRNIRRKEAHSSCTCNADARKVKSYRDASNAMSRALDRAYDGTQCRVMRSRIRFPVSKALSRVIACNARACSYEFAIARRVTRSSKKPRRAAALGSALPSVNAIRCRTSLLVTSNAPFRISRFRTVTPGTNVELIVAREDSRTRSP